jgi:hypothetical protein
MITCHLRQTRLGLEVTPGLLMVVFMTGMVLAGSASSAAAATGDNHTPVLASVDIRPGICPNHLRIGSPLAIPIAITGRADFEVAAVDPSTVLLSFEGSDETLGPVAWAYADVGTPIVGGLCACHKLRGDGIDDLEFQFPIKDIVSAFDLGDDEGDMVELSLTGRLVSGEEFEGRDCAILISGAWEEDELGREVHLLTAPQTEQTPGHFKFAYNTTVSDRVRFTIHDVTGRVVAVLNDMDMAPGIYTATWNGLGQDKKESPPGIYFARVSNSLTSDIMKITLSH